MANTNSSKGNPASTRMSNPNNKKRRVNNKAANEAYEKNAERLHPDYRAASHYNAKAGKKIAGGMVSRNGMANFYLNKFYHELKEENLGYGQRAVRRLKNGTTKNTTLTQDEIDQLRIVQP